ncbi:MAG: alpha/beta hydrolase, partial [Verrucomicrobiales bacterium]|nr:alpha/beta hydrolase [Verrucomicrobiales bacterium]
MKHLLFSLLLAATVAAAEKPAKKPDPVDQIAAWCQPSQVLVYKHVAGRDLELHVFAPKGAQPGKKAKRACFVAIHGGGWQGGEPQRFYPFAECFASQGMLGISVQYRLVKKGEPTTVFNCVEDIRSAMRYIKAHAEELGIDPEKIVVCGGSAGGHLAAATALFDDVNDPQDDLSIDPTPTAMVLLFPVIDTSTEGYGNAKIGDDWKR